MRDSSSHKPRENPLQKEMDILKQRYGSLKEFDSDIERISEKLRELEGFGEESLVREVDENGKETERLVPVDEMREKLTRVLRHLEVSRSKIEQGIHGQLVRETDVIDPDKNK